MADLYALLKQFNAIGGMSQTGQSGFCLLMALWQKANELKWINQFTMTNTELLYKAGFNSEKTLIQVRNKLNQLGYFEYIKPRNRRQCGTYILEYDLLKLLGYLPEVSNEVSSEVNSEGNSEVSSEVSSEVNINELNITKLNKTSSSDHLALNRADDDDQFSEVAKEFGQVFGYPPNQTQVQMITSFLTDGLTTWHILEALKRTAQAGATSPKYTQAILQRWVSLKAFTPDDVDRLDKLRQPKSRDQDRKFSRDDFTFAEPPKPDPEMFPFLAAVTKEDDDDVEQETDRSATS